jgi:alanine racemase
MLIGKEMHGRPISGRPMADPSLARTTSNGLLYVDLGALRRNYRSLRAAVAPAQCAGVVKADAYGLGAVPVLKALLAEDCNTFFVATLGEAKRLRALAPGATFYVLNGLPPRAATEFAAAGVRPVLNSVEEIRAWAAHNERVFKRLPAGIQIDTGMNRLGLSATEAGAVSSSGVLEAFPLSLAMSHLACADEPDHPKNAVQRDAFAALSGLLHAEQRSLAASAGIFLGSGYHFDLVRPGIALYGGRFSRKTANAMEPVVRLQARVAQIRDLEKGDTLGYGGAYTIKRRTRIATLTAGYADGFFRRLGSSDEQDGWAAYFGDHRAPVLGRISMDLMMVDITGIPDTLTAPGMLAELIGDHISVDDIADAAGTIGYEILTSLGQRYERVYTGS